jgi:hypothetical protein
MALSDYYAPEDIASGTPAGSGPVGFLFKNPNNTVTNNVVADSVGTAYWYKLDQSSKPCTLNYYIHLQLNVAVWPNPKNYKLYTARFGTFSKNVAHSMYQGFVNCLYGNPSLQLQPQLVDSLSVYAVDFGIPSISHRTVMF